jgi:hypothetical protein
MKVVREVSMGSAFLGGEGKGSKERVRRDLSEIVLALNGADLGGLGDAHGFGSAESEAE